MVRPIQKAEKFPATRPERMFSEAPPWWEALVISRTWRDDVLVKTLVNSGITAPATVPQLMITDSTHQSAGTASPLSPRKPCRSSQLATNVAAMDTAEVSHTRLVSGCSRSNSFFAPNSARLAKRLISYDTSEVTTIRMRMANSHTMSVAPTVGTVAMASAMNAISATPVTPYVSKPSAVGPTESPALSPVQSAMTPGFFGSSSGSWKTIFIRSAPMSAILVKMPPQMRSALAPSDSPMAKPRKLGPTRSPGRNTRMQIMKNSSTHTSSRPTDMPDCSGMESVFRALPPSAAKDVRELATVLMRMPNHATT